MEPRFGHDFSQVRVHTDGRAAESAGEVGARAYTLGEHIVFGPGGFSPGPTSSQRLVAHELAHVVQQRESPRLGFLQRRESDYGERGDSDTYTLLEPKKLNEKGPFSGAVLYFISLNFTDITGDRATAKLILKLLESSSEFLTMAKALDAYYKKDSNPEIFVGYGFAGTMFIPAGELYQWRYGEEATARRDLDIIHIDPSSNPKMQNPDPSSKASGEEQLAMAVVGALVHETAHAYRHVSKVVGSGMSGFIADEKATRLKERDVLKQISKASASKGIQEEASTYIKTIGTGLSDRAVALSITSGDHLTYLEKYYVEQAIGLFSGKFEASDQKAVPGLDKLEHPSVVTSKTLDSFKRRVGKLMNDLPTEREFIVDKVKGDPEVRTIPALISEQGRTLLRDVLSGHNSFKDLTDAMEKGKKLSSAERSLLFYVILLESYAIKGALKAEHEQSTLDPKSKEHRTFCDQLARKYLGRIQPYDGLSDK